MKLGDNVRFTQVLERRWNTKARELHWIPVDRAGEGILVGYRNQYNGFTDYTPDGPVWVQSGTVRSALVAVSLFYRNPTRVPANNIEAI